MKTEDTAPRLTKRAVGRPKGSRNVKFGTSDVRAIVAKHGNPLEQLLKLAKNRRVPVSTRIACWQAALPFCMPRLASQEIHQRVDSHSEIKIFQSVLADDPSLVALAETISLAFDAKRRDMQVRERQLTHIPLGLPAPAEPANAEANAG